ncbi:mechanosensitive ion channel family protein [Pseudomonas saudimassiliensis]|uniref:Small-conductance mechanosensitive channel n=1 Tax=Pseudomonas saudimassiliensis TaxID=1461581 RepID=A0A078M5M3_9PSED|nr:mechanosensitive ion channel domain-containing protein [Pseudomonas saudimassiliensis]CEA02728.1 mechanosensitive ion channel family protein [Pseudomonas saudimassiliensis]CEF25926.1 mechanosensitive ion channel family protein [Pseudomonas saudimassiliensis]
MEQFLSRMNDLQDQWLPLLVGYSSQLLLALVTLLIGWWIIGRVTRAVRGLMQRRAVDPTLHGFIGTLVNIGLKALLLISVAGMVGIETTSFIALIGAAGLAVGLALQGSLANFAGGILILVLRPIRVGEYIQAQGVEGTVASIQIFHTILKTGDNKTVIVPNGALSNGSIVNFSRQPTRRVQLDLDIAYEDNVKHARKVLLKLAHADSRVLKDPEPAVWLAALGESSVSLSLRVWVKTEDFWGVYWSLLELAKEEFELEGITVPYPQRVVHQVVTQA